MKDIDFLFIHPSTHYRSQAQEMVDMITFIIMPLGTIALADFLEQNGYSAKIYHTGIEQMHDRGFRLEDIFKEYDPSVVGIDLHWYVHSYDAMRIAQIVKQHTNAFTVMGGFTSSFYAEEILSKFDCIDAVIAGDASVPLLKLMKNIPRGRLDQVPNLVFRANDSIKRNDHKFIADEHDLGRLNYSNFKLLSNYEYYHKASNQAGDLDPYGFKIHLKKMVWVPLGRGCTVDCSYCGGGADAQARIVGRRKPVFHPTEQVVRILARLEEEHIDSTYMDFDPYQDRDYYHGLFEMIRREKIDISTQFAHWSLSDRSFIRDFARTFNPLYSTMVVSPESGSEEVRKKNKGFYYDNQKLFQWLDNTKNQLIPVEIYFASGLSWETQNNFKETIELAKIVLDDYPVVSISCNPIQMEPGGKRYIQPEKFGVILKWGGFMDYYTLYKKRSEGLPVESQIGYETIWQTEEQIINNSIRFDEFVGSSKLGRWEKIVEGSELLHFKEVKNPNDNLKYP